MSAPDRPWESPEDRKKAEARSEISTGGIGCLLMLTFGFFALLALFILAALLGL